MPSATTGNDPEYQLRLFILGSSAKSVVAQQNLRRLFEAEIPGRYHLEVVDVVDRPDLAEQDRVIATPTLIKLSPLPVHRIIGDMSLTDKVLLGLGLGPRRAANQRGAY